jgi:hypothetical protein
LTAAVPAATAVGDDGYLRAWRQRYAASSRAQVAGQALFGQVVGRVFVVHDWASFMSRWRTEMGELGCERGRGAMEPALGGAWPDAERLGRFRL